MVWRGLNTDEVAEPNAFAVTAAVAAFTKGGEWLYALNSYIDKNKKLATDYINTRIKGIRPIQGNATYLLWMDIRDLPENGAGFCEFLRKKTGLILSDGEIYGRAGKGFLRMNLASPESMLEDGLSRLKTGAELYQK